MDPYEFIKDAIIIGKFEPGKRLTEEALAEELNVSRTPIREAMKQLESDGLITPLERRGVIVRKFSIDDIRQIYNLRALLESYATSEAVLSYTNEDIQKMIEANNLFEKAISIHKRSDISSNKNIQYANQAFHDAIFGATKNEHLQSLISKVIVVPLVFRSFYWYSEQQLLQSLEVHKIILEAFQNKEPERAKVAMQEHIFQARDYVLKHENKIKIELEKGEV